MGIVRFALRLPHTFYVLAVLVLFLGATAVVKMPTDIFPEINIPVVTIIWQYTGLSTPEMEQRVTTYSEYSLSSSVNGIQDIEAQTLNGISVQKVFFQPDVNLDLAIAQIVAGTNSIRALLPTGIQPPIVVQYNASSVPVLQIALSSDTLNEQQLYDYGIYRLRQQLAPIHGITLPTPAGGKYRQIMVDIDPLKLQAKGLTPLDVVNAVNVQNLTVPAGTAKIGDTQFSVRTNALPTSIEDLNNIPVKFANGATVFVKDVGQVHDGFAVQQNVVRVDGRRSVLLSIIKNGNASTLAVVNAVKQALVVARAAAPPGMQIKELFDQSVFVKASIEGLLKEGAIAACLTALMIVLFLGSWRSTLIVMISIPLSVLSSLVVLYFLGETINTMTLGGLALAVGILVDDSTVTIENTHRLLAEERMPLPAATLHGAAGIAVPTLVKLDTPIMRAGAETDAGRLWHQLCDERNRYLENVDVELIGCAKSGHSETPRGAYASRLMSAAATGDQERLEQLCECVWLPAHQHCPDCCDAHSVSEMGAERRTNFCFFCCRKCRQAWVIGSHWHCHSSG
jgi:multidrug efflux pump subunit AcrB